MLWCGPIAVEQPNGPKTIPDYFDRSTGLVYNEGRHAGTDNVNEEELNIEKGRREWEPASRMMKVGIPDYYDRTR